MLTLKGPVLFHMHLTFVWIITTPKKPGCASGTYGEKKKSPRRIWRSSSTPVWGTQRGVQTSCGVLCHWVTGGDNASFLIDDRLRHSHSPTADFCPRGGDTNVHVDTTENHLCYTPWLKPNGIPEIHLPICRSERDALFLTLTDAGWHFGLASPSFADNLENLQPLVQERLTDLLCVLKAVIRKHQTLNSVDILGAAGAVIAKVKGQ